MNWNHDTINQLSQQMAHAITTLLAAETRPVHLVGIHTGGVWIAELINQHLPAPLPLCTLATHFYRDDFEQRGMKLNDQHSNLPANIDDSIILLVDDVLMSGRTIRAALNELFDYGRPAKVWLAVLFDVGQRELPIQADICGQHLAIRPQDRVELRGPAPLRAELIHLGDPHP